MVCYFLGKRRRQTQQESDWGLFLNSSLNTYAMNKVMETTSFIPESKLSMHHWPCTKSLNLLCEPQLWPQNAEAALASCTSNSPQNDIGTHILFRRMYDKPDEILSPCCAQDVSARAAKAEAKADRGARVSNTQICLESQVNPK